MASALFDFTSNSSVLNLVYEFVGSHFAQVHWLTLTRDLTEIHVIVLNPLRADNWITIEWLGDRRVREAEEQDVLREQRIRLWRSDQNFFDGWCGGWTLPISTASDNHLEDASAASVAVSS